MAEESDITGAEKAYADAAAKLGPSESKGDVTAAPKKITAKKKAAPAPKVAIQPAPEPVKEKAPEAPKAAEPVEAVAPEVPLAPAVEALAPASAPVEPVAAKQSDPTKIAAKPSKPAAPKAIAKPKAPVARKAAVKSRPAATAKPAANKRTVQALAKPVPVQPSAVAATKAPVKAAKQPAKIPVTLTSAKEPTLTELKERIMATTKKTPDLSKFVSEIKDKAKSAYEKGSAIVGEAGEFTKGNVEAVVESSKILASGVQAIGREYVEESKSAFETVTADLKKIAAVKSPTEFFQLQGEIARRNFDSAIAFGSKSSEKFVKLSNDAFAPISTRVSLAVEKVSKAA